MKHQEQKWWPWDHRLKGPPLLDQLLFNVIDCVYFSQVACRFSELHKVFLGTCVKFHCLSLFFLLLNVLLLALHLSFVTQQCVQCLCLIFKKVVDVCLCQQVLNFI